MQLDEMAHEKVATEERLNTLLEQPFIKNAGTESETYKRLQEVERLTLWPRSAPKPAVKLMSETPE